MSLSERLRQEFGLEDSEEEEAKLGVFKIIEPNQFFKQTVL